MQHERPHRSISTAEVGVADVGKPGIGLHPAAEGHYPEWLLRYERRRPRWLMEMLAEFIGTAFYVGLGAGAELSLSITTTAQLPGYGSLLNISLGYGLGIVFGLTAAAGTSGAHLSPGYTIAFAAFRGFPWRKVPQYIIAQITGAFVAALLVYTVYGQQEREIIRGLTAFGQVDTAFTPQGVVGALAVFPTPGQSNGLLFLNEFIATTMLAVLVFSVLDPSNLFVHFATGPWLIGLAYAAVILAFAVDTVTLNTARDLGGQFAAACIYGRGVFLPKFSAIAALTNIAGSLVGAALQTFLLSDHRRVMLRMPPDNHPLHPDSHKKQL